MYYQEDCIRDLSKAVDWLEKAANAGGENATYMLMHCKAGFLNRLRKRWHAIQGHNIGNLKYQLSFTPKEKRQIYASSEEHRRKINGERPVGSHWRKQKARNKDARTGPEAVDEAVHIRNNTRELKKIRFLFYACKYNI